MNLEVYSRGERVHLLQIAEYYKESGKSLEDLISDLSDIVETPQEEIYVKPQRTTPTCPDCGSRLTLSRVEGGEIIEGCMKCRWSRINIPRQGNHG